MELAIILSIIAGIFLIRTLLSPPPDAKETVAAYMQKNKKNYIKEALNKGFNGPTPRTETMWGKTKLSDKFWKPGKFFYTFNIPLENGNVIEGCPVPDESPISNSRLTENEDYVKRLVSQITGNLGSTIDEQFSNLRFIMEGWPLLVALGNEIVPFLLDAAENKNMTTQTLVTQLLGDIARDTKNKFGYQTSHFLCECCFTRYTSFKRTLFWANAELTFYGCRTCGQSRKCINHKGTVVAVLDNQVKKKYYVQNNQLNVNWILHRAMFDFKEIKIVRATDEDIEKFVVQLGNDTDELRRPYYKQMPCLISTDCELTENTLRILTRTFENIETKVLTKRTN